MRIGTSRADRLGFIVFVVFAGLLAVLFITSMNNDDAESAQSVSTFADLPEATAVPTTAAIVMPAPTPTKAPVVVPAAEPEDDEADDGADAGDESSTADGTEDDGGDADAPDAGTSEVASAAPAVTLDTNAQGSANVQPAAAAPNPQLPATAVPNPQAPATAVPNPQAPATAVPNPRPPATAVPNPQAPAAAVPNPQAPAAPVNVPAPAPAGGTFTHTLTAVVGRPTLYNAPGGSPFMPTFNGTALPAVNPTVFGNPLVYRVLAGTPEDGTGWAQVYVPARPNGTTAWVRTSEFRWGSSNRMIQINVSTNTVTVFEGANVLLTTQAVTGKSSSPTPLASGWVEEIMAGPGSAYGPRLLSLGIFSNALNSFSGSVPKIALHGTNNPSLMGQYASNGCIRVRNEIITQIAGLVTPGSKVQIVA